MVRAILKVVALGVLVAAGSVGIVYYRDHFSAQHKINQLEAEKAQLAAIVQRLETQRRVADVLVTGQRMEENQTVTDLLWVEYARDGKTALDPRRFTIRGREVHIDALVVKFDNESVKQNDPLRGQSIALFTRIYGDRESPASAQLIDEPGRIPQIYRGTDPRVSEFEKSLWDQFWQLTEDAVLRQKMGVRIANGQGVFQPVRPDRLYTLTIETNGGVNITSKPIEPIYQQILKEQGAGNR